MSVQVGSDQNATFEMKNEDILNFWFLAKCQETPVFDASMNETASAKSCHYWTFFPPYKCYILDGCKETQNPEAKSGERNCPPGKWWKFCFGQWYWPLWILLLFSFVPLFCLVASFGLSFQGCELHPQMWRVWGEIPGQCHQYQAVCK